MRLAVDSGPVRGGLGVVMAALVGHGCQPVEAHAPAGTTPQWQALSGRRPTPPGRAGALVGRPGSPTAVWSNLAGWNAPHLRPSNRSTSLAVSPDGQRVAVAWLHNGGAEGPPTGEPTAYAAIGLLSDPRSFSAPVAIGTRPFSYTVATAARQKYNGAHNAPVVLPVGGGFLALSVPMNANGYAELRPATGYGYAVAQAAPGSTGWSAPALAPVRDTRAGSSLSEMSGGQAPDGTVHLVGQGHLGAFQGAFAHQWRGPGQGAWGSRALASAYRPRGMNYFAEGVGAIGPDGALHVAFAWNRQGATPMYGLYYMVSRDGGASWRNAAGQPLTVPLQANGTDRAAAVIPANLGTQAYSGAAPGVHGLSLAVAPDGRPVIVRLHQQPGNPNLVQARVHAFTGSRWTSVAVGWPSHWNQGGTGVAVNARTNRVNVLLLEPGTPRRPAQVLRFDTSLTAVRQGKVWWNRQAVGEATNRTGYASSLTVATVRNSRFVFLFEPDYKNPGRVSPVMGQAVMK